MRRRVLAAALALLIPAGLTAARAQQPTCNNADPPPGLSFPYCELDPAVRCDVQPKPVRRPGAAGVRHLLLGVLRGAQLAIEPRWDADGRPDYFQPDGTARLGGLHRCDRCVQGPGGPPDPWGGTDTFLESVAPNISRARRCCSPPPRTS